LVDIKDKLVLTDSQLGIAVLFIYLGIVAVSPVAAVSLRNLGSQVSTFIGAVGLSIMLPFIPCASTLLALIATMFVYGFAMGLMDISMNSSAILTEVVAGKPLLGAFHGSYSVAAAVGSVIGGALKAQQYIIYSVFNTASLLSLVLTVLFLANVYNFKQEEVILDFQRKTNANGNYNSNEETASLVAKEAQGDVAGYGTVEAAVDDIAAAQTTSTRLIAFYSMVGFLAAFGESGIVTWSIVYFNKEIHASEMAKPLGFTCFMVCMALGRFGCDHLRGWIGRRYIVRIGGILANLGLLLLVFAPGLNYSVLVACVGLSVTGLGLSTLIPTMLSSAGHIPGGAHAGTSIAIVSMFTNSGAIVSAPLIGVMSDGFSSMRLAFLCDAILLGLLVPLSWGIPEETNIFKRTTSTSSDDVHSKLHVAADGAEA